MTVYHSLTEIPRVDNTVITIGTFDGMHRGHRMIVDAVIAKADELAGRSLVITFDPHPQEVLRRTGEAVPLLTTIEERIAEFGRLGVEGVLVLPFTAEFAALPWKEFCDLLIEHVGIGHIIFGHDHAFGRNREGNAASLRGYGAEHNFDVTEIGPLIIDGEAISSTKIRRAIIGGDIDKATHYLGRNYTIIGTVVRGDGRGRTLGIPTANIRPLHEAKLVPANGVYCITLAVDGEEYRGMANIGHRPTFTDGSQRTIEANIFDFDRDIYDHTVLLEFRKFVRSEQKFSSAEEFLSQLEKDRAICRAD